MSDGSGSSTTAVAAGGYAQAIMITQGIATICALIATGVTMSQLVSLSFMKEK